ncbi:carnitine O-acetyltransferase [Phlebotomus argentipes]|uniref:carnitine O-acetyltransferase n=1 Tax=Phlebotomus argentipes TaxID=94469 RepID=UPI0028936170|nr:carnitine O-acetyltransferase [Phlebotomus argentipes]
MNWIAQKSVSVLAKPGSRMLVANTRALASFERPIQAKIPPGIQQRSTSSSGKSLENPQNLPHLPVPSLKDTLLRFLATVQPHLNEEEFRRTRSLLDKFSQPGGDGETLQKLLEARAGIKENWLAEWWLKTAYLGYRDPVVVWSSPGIVFPERKFSSERDRLAFAAKVITASLRFKGEIDNERIPMEKFGKSELDMQQYRKIFGTCRIPGRDIDKIEFHPKSKHIVVIHRGNIYKVTVYGGADLGELLSEEELIEQLQECVKGSRNPHPVGILTSDNRNNWGKAYEILSSDPQNRDSLAETQKALFVLSLDDAAPRPVDYKTVTSHQVIHGGGSRQNAGNRWYDKTVQFIVGEDGLNGLTYEHTPAEGGPIAVLTDQILKYADSEAVRQNRVGIPEKPKLLAFNLSAEAKECISEAAKNIDALSGNLDMDYLHFKEFGKGFIKSHKLSPDSFIQIALQYTFLRLHGVPGAHYESAHTRLFVHGRTETIRSCSNDSVAFARAMMQSGSNEKRVEKLLAAIKAHKDYTMLAMQGKGVDRHLLGLKLTAQENNLKVPELFSDAGYLKSSHMRLSTSQVASKYEAYMCYGPLVDNGYGCCYNPREDDMLFGISAFHSCPETSSQKFSVTLKESLMDMFKILSDTGRGIKSKL